MTFASIGRFLCFLGLHSYREDPYSALVRCSNCGEEKDLVYPPHWRGFRKPAPSSVQREPLPVKPLAKIVDRSTPAETQSRLKGSRIEHLTRESLGAGRGKSA